MKNYVFKLLEKYDYDWQEIYKAMKNREFVDDSEVEMYDDYKDFFTIISEDYPVQLKWTSTPPFALFYIGQREVFGKLNYATLIHGGDSLTNYGKELCTNIVKKCKAMNNVLIVCNWTYVGEFCKKQAEKLGVTVLSILDHGRDNVKHIDRKPNTTYVSMFLDDVMGNNKKQKLSMWLAAAFCYRCIIPEIELKQAKMFMIDECLSMGKKVYAYPTNITNCNQGTNYLIKQGASVLMN